MKIPQIFAFHPLVPVRHCLLAVAVLVLCRPTLGANEPRLAVITSPKLRNEAALLTSALSQQKELTVLERVEIEKILAEKNLAASAGGSVHEQRELGQWLGADGLVLLEKSGQEISLRLVAVAPGLVVWVSAAPFPLAEPEAWAGLRAAEIAQRAWKLGAEGRSAIPVSLLRINTPLGGEDSSILEETVNNLLTARLAAEPGVFLLERASLESAVEEKELDPGTRAFLASSWIVEGHVSKAEDMMTLQLHLQPPGGQAGHSLTIKAGEPGELVEKAHAALLEPLKLPATTWDAPTEAARFFREAVWAADNGLWNQAAKAVEAAVALGDRRPETLRWRWMCYDRLSRNVNRPGPAGGFNGRNGKNRPEIFQLAQMARSVRLCREALDFPVDESTSDRRMRQAFRTLTSGANWGQGPTAEATVLLRAATQLIEAGEKGRPDHGDEPEALEQLRREMIRLYEAVVRKDPNLTLQPRPASRVPDWMPLHQVEPYKDGRPTAVVTLPIERLMNGRQWENSPAPYFAFVQECLKGDLPADPAFFQRALNRLAEISGRATLKTRQSGGSEWSEAAKMLAADPSLSCQVGAAVIFYNTGQPSESVAIFARHQDAILEGRLPLDYLVSTFLYGPSGDMLRMLNPNASLPEAQDALADLIVSLIGRGFIPSADLLRDLNLQRFSDQRETFAQALNRAGLPHPFSAEENKPPPQKSSPPAEPSHPVATAAVPPSQPAAAAQAARVLIDCAWVAENIDAPDRPGTIRWAIPHGGKLWIQTEYPGKTPDEVRRVFHLLDLPSLKSRTLWRDLAPEVSSQRSVRQAGPTFATDGSGIYFWNGRGLSYGRDGQVTALKSISLHRLAQKKSEEELAADPDSARLHYLLAVSSRYLPDTSKGTYRKDHFLPVRLRIRRESEMLYAEVFEKGRWNELSAESISMPRKMLIGFCGNAATAEIRPTLLIDGSPAPDGPWQQKQISRPATTGRLQREGETWKLTGAGFRSGLQENDDIFFAYRELEGDVTLEVVVEKLNAQHHGGSAGLMCRSSLDPGAAFLSLFAQRKENAVACYYRRRPSQSGPHLAALCALRPHDSAFVLRCLEMMMEEFLNEEAMLAAKRLLEADPAAARNHPEFFREIFQRSGQESFLTGQRRNDPPPANTEDKRAQAQELDRQAQDFQQAMRHEDAVAAWQEMRSLMPNQALPLDVHRQMIVSLMKVDRPDELKEEIKNAFLKRGTVTATSQEMVDRTRIVGPCQVPDFMPFFHVAAENGVALEIALALETSPGPNA